MSSRTSIADMEKAEMEHVEKGESGVAVAQVHFVDATAGFDPITEARLRKSILWKLDTRMLPMLAVLFLFSFLDRTNIGNAKILGLQTDLGLEGNQYASCLAIFFAFYIASEVPSNLIIKKVSPRIWLGILTMVWGVIGMAMGFATSFSGLLAVRAFLGMAEGGLLPGIVLYLSMMYRRSEIGIRLGLIYSAASLSGAFGGLLATGLYQIGNRGGQAGWRWILIIEGIMTVLVGALAIVVLPSTVDKAGFLTEDERKLAVARLLADRPLATDSDGNTVILEEPFEWNRVWMGVFSLKTWLSALAYLAILTALYSFGLFVPSIVQGLGYTAINAQLYSVPPYAVAAFLTIVAAYVSDRKKIRGPVMLAFLPLSIAGYALIANTHDNKVKYGALFMMAAGLYPSVPPVLVWISNNNSNLLTRAVAIALQLAIANCGGFVAAFIYPASQAPSYIPSHTLVLGLLCAAWVLVALKCVYLLYINRQKAAGKRNKYIGCGDDRDPAFSCGGFPAAFIYQANQAPQYKQAHTIVMGMLAGAWVLIAVKCAYLRYINTQKAAGKYDKFRGCGDDRDPDFKYII